MTKLEEAEYRELQGYVTNCLEVLRHMNKNNFIFAAAELDRLRHNLNEFADSRFPEEYHTKAMPK